MQVGALHTKDERWSDTSNDLDSVHVHAIPVHAAQQPACDSIPRAKPGLEVRAVGVEPKYFVT
jgi:hypothetical protein